MINLHFITIYHRDTNSSSVVVTTEVELSLIPSSILNWHTHTHKTWKRCDEDDDGNNRRYLILHNRHNSLPLGTNTLSILRTAPHLVQTKHSMRISQGHTHTMYSPKGRTCPDHLAMHVHNICTKLDDYWNGNNRHTIANYHYYYIGITFHHLAKLDEDTNTITSLQHTSCCCWCRRRRFHPIIIIIMHNHIPQRDIITRCATLLHVHSCWLNFHRNIQRCWAHALIHFIGGDW